MTTEVQQALDKQQEELPRAYRTEKAVVLKFSKTKLITMAYYPDKKIFIIGTKEMLLDNQNQAIRDEQNNPKWTEIADGIPPITLATWITHLSTMYNEIINAPNIPQRDEQPQKTSGDDVLDIKQKFPEDLQSMLTFDVTPDYIKIAPRQFLGSESFAKIASIVRGIGGEYISAGKASHFRIPRKK
jgi:hypothetical protein